MTNSRFSRLFGGPPRKPETEITQREMDIAASIQSVTEDAVMKMVLHVHKETKQKNLCMAGGVALNCVANGRILREGPFEDLWIQPAAGDAGGAMGSRRQAMPVGPWVQLFPPGIAILVTSDRLLRDTTASKGRFWVLPFPMRKLKVSLKAVAILTMISIPVIEIRLLPST
jgi:hypothetical protein